MSSGDEYDDVYDPFSVPRPTQPNLPRREYYELKASSSSSSSSAPIAIPGSAAAGREMHVSTMSHGSSRHTKQSDESSMANDLPGSPQAKSLVDQPAPPAAWFVADDSETHVR